MKNKILILSALLLFLCNCEKTGNCTDEISFISYGESIKILQSDTFELPYEKFLYAKEISYDTEIKQDTLINQDTVIVADTIIKNKRFTFSVISDTSAHNYLLKPDEEIELGNDKAGEHFNLIKIMLEEISFDNDSTFAFINIYKGVFFSDCSSW